MFRLPPTAVFVQDNRGRLLLPMRPGRARRLVNEHKADFLHHPSFSRLALTHTVAPRPHSPLFLGIIVAPTAVTFSVLYRERGRIRIGAHILLPLDQLRDPPIHDDVIVPFNAPSDHGYHSVIPLPNWPAVMRAAPLIAQICHLVRSIAPVTHIVTFVDRRDTPSAFPDPVLLPGQRGYDLPVSVLESSQIPSDLPRLHAEYFLKLAYGTVTVLPTHVGSIIQRTDLAPFLADRQESVGHPLIVPPYVMVQRAAAPDQQHGTCAFRVAEDGNNLSPLIRGIVITKEENNQYVVVAPTRRPYQRLITWQSFTLSPAAIEHWYAYSPLIVVPVMHYREDVKRPF